MQRQLRKILLNLFVLLAITSQVVLAQTPGPYKTFLPAVSHYVYTPPPYSVRVNMPYFSQFTGCNDEGQVCPHFTEAAITWFGKVTATDNYADIRFSYTNNKLWVYLAAFDWDLFYDSTPSTNTLADYDGATLLISTNGNTGSSPDANTYRFVSSMSWFEGRSGFQAAYRGNGSDWSTAALNFTTVAGYDGAFNQDNGTRGWAMTFEIPFSSLGLSGAPPQGTRWGVSMQMHDRDSSGGTPRTTNWPASMQRENPSTWAQLHFGLPNYGAQSGAVAGSAVIREDPARGIVVPDAGMGGTLDNLCPGDENHIFNEWGNLNYGSKNGFNIMNQSKLTDWPCFSKYYVSFPLNSVPAGKTILSAKLVLHQWGGAGSPTDSQPSLIQVHTINGDWAENSITWNNAPPPRENVARTWVSVYFIENPTQWPGARREWDVTYAAAEAYASGQPLRLALYEADNAYHSGKYFTSSEAESWNINGRPTIEIQWGN